MCANGIICSTFEFATGLATEFATGLPLSLPLDNEFATVELRHERPLGGLADPLAEGRGAEAKREASNGERDHPREVSAW